MLLKIALNGQLGLVEIKSGFARIRVFFSYSNCYLSKKFVAGNANCYVPHKKPDFCVHNTLPVNNLLPHTILIK